MGIRQAAAEKLVRQLLELRLTRVIQLSDEFIATMARMVRAFVDLDEQHQRKEEILKPPPAVPACEGCTTPKGCAHFGCKDQPPSDAAVGESSGEHK